METSQGLNGPDFRVCQANVSMFRTFMGRVARELLAVSEMGQAALVPAMGAWYNVKTPHSEAGALLL